MTWRATASSAVGKAMTLRGRLGWVDHYSFAGMQVVWHVWELSHSLHGFKAVSGIEILCVDITLWLCAVFDFAVSPWFLCQSIIVGAEGPAVPRSWRSYRLSAEQAKPSGFDKATCWLTCICLSSTYLSSKENLHWILFLCLCNAPLV